MNGNDPGPQSSASGRIEVRVDIQDIASHIRALQVAYNNHIPPKTPLPSPRPPYVPARISSAQVPAERGPQSPSSASSATIRPILSSQDSAVYLNRPPLSQPSETPQTALDHSRSADVSPIPMPGQKPISSEVSLSSIAPRPRPHEISDLLSQTISDFESLLDEALLLARQTAVAQDQLTDHNPRTAPIPHPGLLTERPASTISQPNAGPPIQARRGTEGRENNFPPIQRSGTQDWAYPAAQHKPNASNETQFGRFHIPEMPPSAASPSHETREHLQRRGNRSTERLSKAEIKEYIASQNRLPIAPRSSSQRGGWRAGHLGSRRAERKAWRELGDDLFEMKRSPESDSLAQKEYHDVSPPEVDEQGLDLHNTRHLDLKGTEAFELGTACQHQPVARDWHNHRKRAIAIVTCINTALLGLVVGIYAGEVPSIQYVVVDLHHRVILGNTFLYLGLAFVTLLLWPLPLLHGRKPYTIGALAVALPLQIPQGIAVGAFRSYTSKYRVLLLLCRALSGVALGFAVINFKATLLDLFGASLMSANPHQEIVHADDIRRHGGGMGLWLGWWSWCTIGAISVGFFIGAAIINNDSPAWGFWVTTFCIMAVMFINIVTPEVRRSAYRRTITEVDKRGGVRVRRVARGEVKMHIRSRGPLWWGEEVKAGMQLSLRMLKQPGFFVLAVYLGWVHAQYTLVLMLLGALASKYYHLRPIYVGLCVLAMAIGALLATPFQKASYFSRARHHPQRTDSMTFEKRVRMSSHLIRRLIFMVMLPIAAAAYTATASGPPLSVAWPTIMAALVAFLSNLAIAECNGLIMETFDVSDLQPGMTGRQRTKLGRHNTNFSCHPRVMAGFMISQGLGYFFTAAATAVCSGVERRLGAREATGVVAAILMGLTVALTLVLVRVRTVKMIPDRLSARASVRGSVAHDRGDRGSVVQANEARRKSTMWEPVIIGIPSGTTRRVSLLELGGLSRWMEIRRRNRLIDEDEEMGRGERFTRRW